MPRPKATRELMGLARRLEPDQKVIVKHDLNLLTLDPEAGNKASYCPRSGCAVLKNENRPKLRRSSNNNYRCFNCKTLYRYDKDLLNRPEKEPQIKRFLDEDDPLLGQTSGGLPVSNYDGMD